VHLAARAGVRPSIQDPALYAAVNVLGTTVILDAARAARISRLAADCSRASRSAMCSSFEARDTRVVRSLRSPTVASPGPV